MPGITQQMHAFSFEDMIFRRGRVVKWREATICSCWNLESGQPQYNCQACYGFGYTYNSAPISAKALVTNLTVDKSFDQSIGSFEYGDAILTIPKRYPNVRPNGHWGKRDMIDNPMYDIGLFDLVTLTDDEIKFTEVLVHNRGIGGRPPDTLSQEEITRIKTVQKTDPNTGQITVYQPGVDYQLNGNTIQWIGTNKPADGEKYDVTYFHHPSYFVFMELPKPRYQDKQFMPRSVVIRLRMGGVVKTP